MSLQFSNTTTKLGIIQSIERYTELGTAGISGNATRLADFTADVNLALDYIFGCIFENCSKWQLDDINHTDYPILTTDLVSGQVDYAFTTDNSGNLIVDIHRVMIKTPSGEFVDLEPISATDKNNSSTTLVNGLGATGTPTRYGKMGNGIFLDVPTNYNSTGGLKIYVNREASRFTTSDTTKKAGFVATFHEYLALRPSYLYAMRKGLKSKNDLYNEMTKLETKILQHYGLRAKDQKNGMRVRQESTR